MATAARACPACKTPLPEEAHFCLHCGTPTPTEPGVPARSAATDASEIARVRAALSGRGYAIERMLGEGGMATVYLATDTKHRRQVAVKVMRSDLAATLGAERFLREVEIAAQLNHPHILPVHDSGEADGVLYYVMPFVEGESLHEKIRRETQLPLEEALRIAREVCEALGYAHGRKIIHRDIKPANIMLSNGHALVADFGIARAVGGGATGPVITKTGLAVGTPQYMSPEQASGSGNVDGRSDIYAVGCVLYEMLAGESPFNGPTPQAIVMRSMTEAPRPLSRTREGVTPAIETVINRSLTKNPADRWQTATDFAKALRDAEDQVRFGSISAARTPITPVTIAALTGGPSPARVWGTFAATGALALALVFGLVRRWGLPSWALGLAVVLLLIGAVVLLITAQLEKRRAQGESVEGLAGRFTWRNATIGGLGALGLWAIVAILLIFRGPAEATSSSSVVRLAVLPFENRGNPEDGYFVDGVADQVRGKLMTLAGFQVIARTSSDQYKATKKTPQQIGRELGVDYLLTSTVTWAKAADGKGRVQVVPELINVKTGAGAWQQSFDAELTDLFKVQGDIATQVAGALNVALAPQEKAELAERPTKSLEAYDYFLKAKAVLGNAPADLRKTIVLYQQAIALDSTFAEAWSRMALTLSQLYFNGTPTPELAARTKQAVERARAIAPQSYHPLLASSRYKYFVAGDVDGAVADAMAAIKLAPNNAELLGVAGQVEIVLGRWTEARTHAEAAVRLDPRSRRARSSLLNVLFLTHKYPEALSLARELQSEGPTLNILEYVVGVYLMQGDLPGARAELKETPPGFSRDELVAYLSQYNDLYWVLEDQDQRRVMQLSPSVSPLDGDRGSWATVQFQLALLRGDRARARAFADTARTEYEKQLKTVPDDPQRNLFYGMALAVLGRKQDAIARAERGAGFLPLEKDQNNGPYMQHQLLRVYLLVGENEKALDLLERLTKIPYLLTPGYLRIDPNFAPLRGHPRFERLLQG